MIPGNIIISSVDDVRCGYLPASRRISAKETCSIHWRGGGGGGGGGLKSLVKMMK